jgi:hypothetical protein
LWAAVRGHDAVVKLLLENRADTEAKDSNGWTPLFWAAAKADKVEFSSRLRRQQDSGRRAEVKDGVAGDSVPWMRLVEDDIQGDVAGAIDQFKPWRVFWTISCRPTCRLAHTLLTATAP